VLLQPLGHLSFFLRTAKLQRIFQLFLRLFAFAYLFLHSVFKECLMSKTIVDTFFETSEKLPKGMKEFLKWLQKNAPPHIDRLVHELHDDLFDEIDCLDCANCCKTVGPAIKDVDIERLSKYLKIKPSKLIEQYMEIDDEQDYVFRSHPCPFLCNDNYCSVYEGRPKACREYPHTDRRRVMQLIQLHKKNIECCPVVFELFNRLKSTLKR
jgi:uncharacterized protein